MNSDEFMDLALRVTEGTVTPEERARFEEELIRQPQRREEWLALRRDLEAVREATAATEALSGTAESIPADRLAALLGTGPTAAAPRRRFFWPAAGLAAAAAIALVVWLSAPPTSQSPRPDGGADRVAFVVPQGGEIFVASSDSVRTSGLPQPLAGGETVTVPAGHGALLLTADGHVTEIRGSYRVMPRPSDARPGPRWFTAPLALLQSGPVMRGSEVIRVLSPQGATTSTGPTVDWVAEAGRTYDVELGDALHPTAPVARVAQVVPPLEFHRLRQEPLAVGGIYLLRIVESGVPATRAGDRFMVVSPPPESAGATGPAAVAAAAFAALNASPARTGDAWILLQQLPADWRESELGRRLAAAVGAP